MNAYLPCFTLRRALVAVALFALFLGWLRPDRAVAISTPIIGGSMGTSLGSKGIAFYPMWPDCKVTFAKYFSGRKVFHNAQLEFNKSSER